MKVTISELLGIKELVNKRYNELMQLRNQNSHVERSWRGVNEDKLVEKKPTYDAVKLDKLIARLAQQIRLIDTAIKKTNATVVVDGYEWDDAVLGELEAAEATVETKA